MKNNSIKRLFIIPFLISSSWSQENYERSGDPKDSSFPGGYVSISYEFDLKSKEKGYQISFGVALPGIGESGNGPFVFPGVAFGKRRLQNNQSYTYSDFQVVGMAGGFWGGGGYGFAKINGKEIKRSKRFLGWLVGGYVSETVENPDLGSQSAFSGLHLGFAFPLIGGHFYP